MATPIPWTIREILDATGGEALSAGCPAPFPGICIDSRKIQPREVFVAIEGPRFDGHDFIDAVVESRAGCLVLRRDKATRFSHLDLKAMGICCIAVDDTVNALGDLASYRRRQADIPVVAITGSTGKTTTREMTVSICRRQFETLSTSGNFNNEIGLPLTLFNLATDHRLAVVELGMNHPGEIHRLSAICSPDIGVITNIGPAHLEGLRDVASVAKAKGELLENIRPGGTAVINADDAYARKLTAMAKTDVVLFGSGADASIRSENIERQEEAVSFVLVMPGKRVDVTLTVSGSFMVQNALAAAAAAHLLQIHPETIKAGLESFRPVEGRMMIYRTDNGAYIIDDTYNANPMSMAAAINALADFSGKGKGVLVAGDMLELGEQAAYYHEQIGKIAAGAGLSRMYLTGAHAGQVAHGAKAAGMSGKGILIGSKADIVKDLASVLEPGDWVLVKGSRSTGMEEIVDRMAGDARVRRPVFQPEAQEE